jgi:hypothetical protein
LTRKDVTGEHGVPKREQLGLRREEAVGLEEMARLIGSSAAGPQEEQEEQEEQKEQKEQEEAHRIVSSSPTL